MEDTALSTGSQAIMGINIDADSIQRRLQQGLVLMPPEAHSFCQTIPRRRLFFAAPT